MNTSDYNRPFELDEFRGYFRWPKKLTKALGGNLYHACHEEELDEILNIEELPLRSEWVINLPQHKECKTPGAWTGLNYFNDGNHYGPCLIEFPLQVLNGKRFIVFYRRIKDRNYHYFVQYESRIPLYGSENGAWKFNKLKDCLDYKAGTYSRRSRDIYEIIITQPIPLDDVVIYGVKHEFCISGKCEGRHSADKSDLIVRRCAKSNWRDWMAQNEEYRMVMKRFPSLAGRNVKLFDPKYIEYE